MKHLHQQIPADSAYIFVDLNDDVLVVIVLFGRVSKQLQARDVYEVSCVHLVVFPVHLHKVVKALEGSQSHSSGRFVHLAVGADVFHAVHAGKTEVVHQPGFTGQFVVVGGDNTALESV